jgi:hypothetical protein
MTLILPAVRTIGCIIVSLLFTPGGPLQSDLQSLRDLPGRLDEEESLRRSSLSAYWWMLRVGWIGVSKSALNAVAGDVRMEAEIIHLLGVR